MKIIFTIVVILIYLSFLILLPNSKTLERFEASSDCCADYEKRRVGIIEGQVNSINASISNLTAKVNEANATANSANSGVQRLEKIVEDIKKSIEEQVKKG